MRVCVAGMALYYPYNGHLWSRLNWALGLRALDCEVVWLEVVDAEKPPAETAAGAAALLHVLGRHGIELALAEGSGASHGDGIGTLADAATADVLMSHAVDLGEDVIACFRRTVLIDADPGRLQRWLRTNAISLPAYDVYITIGEGAARSDDGREWQHLPQCVSLESWPVSSTPADGAFTTVTHWWGGRSGKRAGFEPYFDLPSMTGHPLEIAFFVEHEPSGEWSHRCKEEWRNLTARGWRLRDSRTLWDSAEYQRYIQASLGEFSCAKPDYVSLDTAWVSDRTLCYLASGKPAIVQHTGPSKILPDRGGLLRFRDPAEAVECLEAATEDYDEHARLARALAEEHFDASKVVSRFLALSA